MFWWVSENFIFKQEIDIDSGSLEENQKKDKYK
jgi:hypothetical protein